MATQVQFRRGTTTQNNAFTGALAEITYDTEVKTLRLHDGTTAGGGAIVATLAGTQTFTNKTLSTNSVWNGSSIGLAFGGTNANITPIAGAVAYSTSSALALTASGTSGQVLTSAGGSAPTWTAQSSLTAGTATTATTATNIAGGSAGNLIIQLDTNQTAFVEAGADGTFLKSTGASTAPVFAAGEITIGSTATPFGGTSTSLAGLDILAATGTSHWTLPVGTTAQRPGSEANGMVRYNSSISAFEGYASNAWSSLGGVKSVDGFTFILAETSAGASNGDLDFHAKNTAGDGDVQVGQWNRTNIKDFTGTLVGTQTTQNVYNTTATTVNAFGAATTLNIGSGAEGATSTFAKNVTIVGNLTVQGTTTTEASAALTVTDSVINLNEGATTNSKDIGFIGEYVTVSDTLYTGFVKDATDGVWKMFSEPTNAPTPGTTVDFTGATFDPLRIGALTATNGTFTSALTYGGVTLSNAVTGTGNMVLSNSPTLTAPALGTPASGNLANCTFPTLNQNTTGSAATLTTARTIGGVSFNGSANINLPGVNAVGNQNTTGSAATLTTARTINGVSFNGSANITITANANNVNTQLASLGVGTAASGTAGEIRATNQITSFFSDDRLKTRTGNIQNALQKVLSLDGFHYYANETAAALGYDSSKQEVGLSAQQVQAILPEVIAPAPIDPQYMTLHYERLVPLLVEAIKEQQKQIEELKAKLGN